MTEPTAPQLSVALLLAADTDKTAAFYRDGLGVPLKAEKHGERHTHYACPLGSVYFTVQSAADLKAPPATGYDSLQLCFTVPDLAPLLSRLRERGIEPLHEPRPFERTTYVTLLDPDGRHVRVMTPWK